MSAFGRVVFSGCVGNLVFQRLQNPFPKCRPLSLSWFPTRGGGGGKCNKQNRSRNEPRGEDAPSVCPAGQPRAGPCGRCGRRERGTVGPPRPLPSAQSRSRLLVEGVVRGTRAPAWPGFPGVCAERSGAEQRGQPRGPTCPAREPRAPSRSLFAPQKCGSGSPNGLRQRSGAGEGAGWEILAAP